MSGFRRYELLESVAPLLSDALVVGNIGFPSQELYALADTPATFYMLGSMGLASSIGLGLSLSTSRQVVSIDGDGSVLMNLGTLATIANQAPSNYLLLIVDNGAYGSTGDQPTYTSQKTNLAEMARAAGLKHVFEVPGEELSETLSTCLKSEGPHVIVAKVAPGSPKLKPIPLSPQVIRDRFREEVGRS